MIKIWDWTINRPRYLISSVSLTSQHAPCFVCDSAHRRRHSQITDNVFEKRTMINNSWNVQQRTHYVTVTYTNHYHITSQYVRYFLPVDKKQQSWNLLNARAMSCCGDWLVTSRDVTSCRPSEQRRHASARRRPPVNHRRRRACIDLPPS